MIPSIEGWPTKAKEAPSSHEVRLTLLDTNPVFQYLRDKCHDDTGRALHTFIQASF